MRKSILILLGCLLGFYSCQRTEIDAPQFNGKSGEVYISLRSETSTRGAINGTEGDSTDIATGTDLEQAIETLDLLIFKEGKYKYRAHGSKQEGLVYSAILQVTEDTESIEVYFLANSRQMVDKLVSSEQLQDSSDMPIADVRKLLVDTCEFSASSYLPMWGYKTDMKVQRNQVSNWGSVEMLRAVLGVDVYENIKLQNFVLESAQIFFAPNKGYVAPDHIGAPGFTPNYSYGDNFVTKSESPEGMITSINTSAAQSKVVTLEDTTIRKTYNVVTNSLYVYENDTEQDTYDQTNRRYTRVIVGGKYISGNDTTMYYYPINFLQPVLDGQGNVSSYDYKTTMRNTKYIFVINSVSGPGYPDPETASESEPININVNIYDWNISNETEAGFDGTYYVSLQSKKVDLNRTKGSYKNLSATSNADTASFIIDFKSETNGKQVDAFRIDQVITGEDTTTTRVNLNGIQNDRFRFEMFANEEGKMNQLKVTSLGTFSTTNANANADTVVMQVGSIRFEIAIAQHNSDTSDWDDGGNIDFDNIGGK